MFSVDPRIRRIAVQSDSVVSLYASLSNLHLAVPGKQAQEAQAFISGVRQQNGMLSMYVTLFLTDTKEMVHYSDQDRPEVAANAYTDLEAEAVGFVESMGFMLENLNFASLPPAEQDKLLQTLPPFAGIPKAPAKPEAASGAEAAVASPAVRLARLFAAF